MKFPIHKKPYEDVSYLRGLHEIIQSPDSFILCFHAQDLKSAHLDSLHLAGKQGRDSMKIMWEVFDRSGLEAACVTSTQIPLANLVTWLLPKGG